MKKIINGQLEAYYEQGWEGHFDCTFVPDINRDAVNGGRGYFLKSGDFLRIVDVNEETIWEGKLQLVRPRFTLFFPERHRLEYNVRTNLKQKGVSYADWVDWFWAEPPLKGEFFRSPESHS